MSRLLHSLLTAACLAGLAGTWPARAADTSKPADVAAPVDTGLSPRILYQFLIGEIANQRGEQGLAASALADLARNTRDVGVARRAAEIALHSRQFDTALETTRLWLELDPSSAIAQQTLSAVLAATNRLDELGMSLARDLAAAGPQLDVMLMRLNRLLGRFPDKRTVQDLVVKLTVPYLDRPEAHFARAQAAANARDAAAARLAIDEALRLRAGWEVAAVFKAQQMEQGAERVVFLQGFLAANPEAKEARLAYARSLVGEKRYADSLAEFRQLLESFPDNPDVINAIGILSLQLDDPKAAEVQFKRLVDLGRGDLNPVYYYLGQIAEEAKNLDEALRRYDKVESGEHHSAALLRGAQLLSRQGRVDEARVRLQKASELLPGEANRFLVAESQLLREAGRIDESSALLRGALEARPDDPDLIYEAALAAERLHQLDEAERLLRRLIALKPDSSQGYNALGYTLADHNIRLDEAEQLLNKALAMSPDDPFIVDSMGWLRFRQGKHVEALAMLHRAYAKRPDPEIAAHIGEVLWAMGRQDEAKMVWRDAAKAFPANQVLSATIKRFDP